MTAGPNDLTTLANAKDWLGIAQSDTTQDALVQLVITAVSGAIQNWLGYNIASATYTEKRDGNNADLMHLRNIPCTAFTSVTIGITPIPVGTTATSSGYFFDDRTVWMIGYLFDRGRRNIQLVYTAGYASTPAAIEEAAKVAIKAAWLGKDRDPSVASWEVPGAYTESVAMPPRSIQRLLPAESLQMLQSYKRVWMV